MQHRLAIGLLFISSLSAVAEPALIQSGEHVGFTRLVTRVANEGLWNLEQTGREVTLRLEGYNEGFDTSQIFELIPKDRIQRVESNKNTITVSLGCDCTASAFDVTGRHVALDIISPQQNQRPPLKMKTRSPHSRTLTNSRAKTDISSRLMGNQFLRDTSSERELASLSDLQMRLSNELGNAATRGVLNATQIVSPIRRAQVDPNMFEHSTSIGPVRQKTERMIGNIRVTTSMDTPSHSDRSQPTVSDLGLWCPPEDATNVASWGDARGFDTQISEARSALFGEFDRLDSDAALLLAKLYIYFGFGAEARQVLEFDPSFADTQRFLFDLAEIMDSGGTTPGLSIQSFSDCVGNVSLWAFLADAEQTNNNGMEPDLLLFELEKLPIHLRQHLTPIVSDRFLMMGDPMSAATALRSLERLPDALHPAATLAQAHIGINSGHTAEGEDKLYDVATANVAQSPEALVSLVDAKSENGGSISPEILALIESYLQELRDTDLEPSLGRAHILALISTNAFDRALAEIDKLGNSDAVDMTIAMRIKLIQGLTENASDIVFLDTFFKQSDDDISPLDTDVKIPLADRLLSLGFASAAHDVVESIPDRPRNTERQMLAAQIALALDQPFQALATLLGVNNEAADILRADAKKMSGAYADAHALYQNANRQDAAARSAWLASNWRDLTPHETPVFGQISALSKPTEDTSTDQIGMLHKTASALEESGAARQTIAEFLNASEISPSTK